MTYEQRAARLERARFWIRVELAIGVLAVLVVAFLFLTGLRDIDPVFYGPPVVAGLLPLAAGIVGVVVGLAWMVWLARQNPERGERTWRYSLVGGRSRRRFHIRADAVIMVLALAAAAFLVITQTGLLEWIQEYRQLRWLVPLAGMVGVVVGLVWLLWPSHHEPELDERTWRYRR
jgi:hypothetical protein